MKLSLPCGVCNIENKSYSFSLHDLTTKQLEENNIYSFICPEGHTNSGVIIASKFELLFTSGAISLLENHLQESVLDITGAMERFKEYYIEIMCIKHGIEFQEYTKSWKTMANQSERQYGAFAFMYLIENKRHFSEKQYYLDKGTYLRNKIIHKGYFPQYEEVNKYANDIYNCLHDIIMDMIKSNGEHMAESLTNRIKTMIPKTDENTNRMILITPVFLNLLLNIKEFSQLTYEKEMDIFNKYIHQNSIVFQKIR